MISLTNEQEFTAGFGEMTIAVKVGSSNPQLQFNDGSGWANKDDPITESNVFLLEITNGIAWRFTNMGDSSISYSFKPLVKSR